MTLRLQQFVVIIDDAEFYCPHVLFYKNKKQPTSVFLVLAVHCSKLYSAKTALNTTKKKLARTAKRRRKEMETGFLKSENISQ